MYSKLEKELFIDAYNQLINLYIYAAVHGGAAAVVRRLPDRRDVLCPLRDSPDARHALRPPQPGHPPRQRPPPRLRPRHRTPNASHNSGGVRLGPPRVDS